MDVKIYRRPSEPPILIVSEKDIRISYGEKWIDFRDGEITICEPDKEVT